MKEITLEEFYKYINSFNKKAGEYTNEEICLIGIMHRNLPVKLRNWNDLTTLLGLNKTGNALRKYIDYYQHIMPEVAPEPEQKENQVETTTDAKNNIEDEAKQLHLAKIKLRDETTKYRQLLRTEARIDEFKNNLIEAISKLPKLVKPKTNIKQVAPNNSQTEAVLMLSDFHIGAMCDNFYNTFNVDVATNRLAKLVQDVIDYCNVMNVTKLNILNLGDLIAGLIHTNARIQQEMTVTDQIMVAAELLANALYSLADAAPTVTYRSCLDNHGRMTANLKEAIETESFCSIIDWYLETRLDSTNIEFIHDNIDAGIGKFTLLNGKKIMFAHGHQDSTNTAMQHFLGATEEFIHYIFLAHEHSEKVKLYQNIRVITNGSLIGTESYALSKRLFNKPSQTLLIFDKDNLIHLSICLDVR